MLIKLHHPVREVSLNGPKSVIAILSKLSLSREAHLVICDNCLMTEDTVISDEATIEIRPVISGG